MDIMQDPLVIEATKELCQAFWRRAQCRRPQSSWFEIERCDKEIEIAEQRGECLADSPAGFGDSPYAACADFDRRWLYSQAQIDKYKAERKEQP